MSTVGHSDGPRHRQLGAVPTPDAKAVPTQGAAGGLSKVITLPESSEQTSQASTFWVPDCTAAA